MTKSQWRDCKECERLEEQGESMECEGCACNVCIAQENNHPLLMKCLEVLEYAKTESDIVIKGIDEAIDGLRRELNLIK